VTSLTAPSTNSLLFVADRPFGSGVATRELLEMMLSAAAFNLETALLLRGAGLSWLHAPECLERLEELPLYGADTLYVSRDELSVWGNPALPDIFTSVSGDEIRKLYRQHGRVIQP
jgi:sulfur relay (sulfurtransferase) DsrF/TusC family protein